jgi:hypothetical protein
MLVSKHTTLINTTPEVLLSTLLDHANLNNYFDAKFTVLSPADPDEIKGGRGCIREVRTFGIRFNERISGASTDGISYEIVGNFPMKSHQGNISFEQEKGQTRVTYEITCIPLWYTPKRLMKFILDSQIKTAFKNLGKAF